MSAYATRRYAPAAADRRQQHRQGWSRTPTTTTPATFNPPTNSARLFEHSFGRYLGVSHAGLADVRRVVVLKDPGERRLGALFGDPGRAVQADPIKPTLKAPGAKRLKLKYDEPLSNVAFTFNMRRYTRGWRRHTGMWRRCCGRCGAARTGTPCAARSRTRACTPPCGTRQAALTHNTHSTDVE